MSVPHWFQRILEYHHIPYEEHQHSPAYSASQLAHAEHVTGRRVAKVVFLNDRGRPIMVVLPAADRLDLSRVQAVLGEPELRLATEMEILGWFKGCEPCAVPPCRLRGDVRILMDRGLAHLGHVILPGGAPDVAVAVRFRDWYRAVRPGVGRFAAPSSVRRGLAVEAPILIVEDEAETNRLLCSLLEREGLVCRGVDEGGKALAAAAQAEPAAILVDLMLPDMSGLEMVERLRREGSLKRVPWIVLTALDDEACRRRAREMGADAYLMKPLQPQALVAELRQTIADARA